MIERLDEYNPNKQEYKMQKKKKTFHNAREFYNGTKTILIAFENYAFPLPKQYPSGMHDWKEHEMDSSHILPDDSGELLPSVKHIKEKNERERVLKKVVKGKYHIIDELYKLLFKAKRHLYSDLIKKHFNYHDLIDMLVSLDNTKSTYVNGVKVSLIKSALRDLKK